MTLQEFLPFFVGFPQLCSFITQSHGIDIKLLAAKGFLQGLKDQGLVLTRWE